MAGLIAALFGGKKRPTEDPLPGIGGYDMPRGPYGEGGFPGSTSAAKPTHTQNADGSRNRQYTASGVQEQWRTTPTRRRNGTPRQPYARDPKQATDTVKRSSPIISRNVPGNQNQRNTTYYGGRQAQPGIGRSYQSAPNPGKGKVTEVFISSDRYTFHGPDGGFESYAVERRMPYRIHARPAGYDGAPSNRGGDLSGQRYTMASKQNLNSGGHGAVGIGRERGPLHRPVRFTQPGPWSANFYDVAPDEGSNAPNMVHRSPTARRTAVKKKHAKAKPESNRDTITRTTPAAKRRSTGTTPRRPRHG